MWYYSQCKYMEKIDRKLHIWFISSCSQYHHVRANIWSLHKTFDISPKYFLFHLHAIIIVCMRHMFFTMWCYAWNKNMSIKLRQQINQWLVVEESILTVALAIFVIRQTIRVEKLTCLIYWQNLLIFSSCDKNFFTVDLRENSSKN